MCRYIETICCLDGQLQNLKYHQQRLDRTFKEVLKAPAFSLEERILELPTMGKYKCRVLYDESSVDVEFNPYPARDIQKLKLVEGGDISYEFKSADRNELTRLFNKRDACDDIIILKNDYCTDAYFANLVFYDGRNWYTPKSPLLKGTRRQYLLDDEVIFEKDIKVSSIHDFNKVSLINAMLDLGEVVVPVDQIY